MALPRFDGIVHGLGAADMYPVDVAVANGRYYVLDPGRYRVVAVDQVSGAIVGQVGGTKSAAPGALSAARGIDEGADGRIYVADSANNRVQVFSPDLEFIRSWGGRGTAPGQLSLVYDVAVGSGLLANGTTGEVAYTVDAGNRIQKFATDGSLISVFATGLNQPRQLQIRPGSSDLYVVNARDRSILVYSANGQLITRFGSEGSGPGQFLGDPRGLAFSPDGATVFVSDDGNQRVQAFSADYHSYLYSITGFRDARGLAAGGDRLVVADEWDHSLQEFSLAADPPSRVRRLFGGAPPLSGVNAPRGLAVDAGGRLIVTDWWNQRVVVSDADGGGYLAWGSRGTRVQIGRINFAWDVAVQPGTNRVFVANRESHEIEVFDQNGTSVTHWGSRGTAPGMLVFPNAVSFGPDGILWVVDSGNNRLQAFTIDASGNGTVKRVYGSGGTGAGGFNEPIGVDVSADGRVWVADQMNHRVQRLDLRTGVWTVLGRPDGNAFTPKSVVEAPDGTIWVTDSSGHEVHIFSSAWQRLAVFRGSDVGAGAFLEPFDVAFGDGGAVFLSDLWNNRVIRLQRAG